MSVIIRFRVFEEDAELTVETAFDVFSVVCEDVWFLCEVFLFFLGVDVLFESLDGGYPGWFADEGCDFACDGLDFREDLDSGGSEEVSLTRKKM